MANVLVVANQTLTGEDLAQFVKARMDEGACAFTLVVPATARADLSGPRTVAPPYAATAPRDSDDDYALARRQLDVGLTELRRLGATVEGDVGDPDPLQAIHEVLRLHQFDEIVLSTLPGPVSRWLRQDLPHKVERRFHIPVRVVTARGPQTP
ncbi:MAG TPA: hypothetical protein VGH11_02735 [Jatrophihabitans sp.]|jgi:nucleotide-binding universal stress UspA family protein